jgi:two-component system chemotaxis sensor kinase CheA
VDDLDKEMKISFIEEARQLLEAAEVCFLDLEASRGGPEVIEQIFRLAHNMKGTSRAVGFGEVAEFTHELENLLLRLKEGKLGFDPETVTLLLACNDHLKHMVEALSLDLDAKFDSRELIARIVSKLGSGAHTSPAAVPSASTEVLGSPSSPEVPSHEHQDWETNDAAVVPPHAETPASHAANYKPGIEMVEDDPHPMDNANAAQAAPAHAQEKKAPAAGGGGGGGGNGQGVVDESIRVSLGRLEKLSDFIGELVILQTVLNQHRMDIPSQLIQRTVGQLGKLSKEIQDISMSLRMIPLKQTFAKLQRIVRDTSKALGKDVHLTLQGEGTEVDKTVLEQVSDPLVHIVRNAIDHGLEMPDERTSTGKPREGSVTIRAFHQGNNLVIEVVDDGKGIDPKRLIRKATEKGLIREDQSLTEQEAINLIFHPGFSTKDQVSEISGRGVGLDVVKTNVERLGGNVQLESEVGAGSVFRIMLPLTLAIIDGMIVQCGDERYVIPITNVHETVQPRKEDVHFVTGKGEMLNLRDGVLPLFKLSSMLRHTNPSKKESWQSIAIIVNSRRTPFAVVVDDIIRQQQIVIKKLGAEIKAQKGLAGSAILGDGKPALILDLNDLMERANAQQGPRERTAAAA